MHKGPFRVFVFPTSNEPGLEILHSLSKNNKIILFGGSSDNPKLDPSSLLLRHHLTLPYQTDRNFKKEFTRLCRKHRINFVFPAIDTLVTRFSHWRIPGVTFITPNSKTSQIIKSKSSTYNTLAAVVPVPRMYTNDASSHLPLFGKRNIGTGGKGSMLVRTHKDLEVAKQNKLLLCEYLPGEEYTVDAVNDLRGNLLFFNARLRSFVGRSISLTTESVENQEINDAMVKIAAAIKIEGPWFAQFKRSKSGILTLLEINCRIGGSSTLTRLSGVNIALISLYIFAGYSPTVPQVKKPAIINRYLMNVCTSPEFDIVIWDLMDTLIDKTGRVDPDVASRLYDFENRGKKQLLVSKTRNVKELMEEYKLPPVFSEIIFTVDKVLTIKKLVDHGTCPANRYVVINDSNVENLALQHAIPEIQTVTPDAIEYLGRSPL